MCFNYFVVDVSSTCALIGNCQMATYSAICTHCLWFLGSIVVPSSSLEASACVHHRLSSVCLQASVGMDVGDDVNICFSFLDIVPRLGSSGISADIDSGLLDVPYNA